MSVTTIFNKGRVLWQEPIEDGLPELPVVLHVDNGGTICLEQEKHVVVSPASVPELCRELMRLRNQSQK